MARYAGWESIPMAQGGEAPVWPLPAVKPTFATWSLGGGRPWGCAQDKCERWHAGVDLTGAPQGVVGAVSVSCDVLPARADRRARRPSRPCASL